MDKQFKFLGSHRFGHYMHEFGEYVQTIFYSPFFSWILVVLTMHNNRCVILSVISTSSQLGDFPSPPLLIRRGVVLGKENRTPSRLA
jgi:hypothetical protein